MFFTYLRGRSPRYQTDMRLAWPQVRCLCYKVKIRKMHPCKALRLCIGRTAHKESRGIAILFLDHCSRRGRGVSVRPRPLFTPGKDLVSIVQVVGWAPRAGQDCWGKSRPHRDSIPRTVHPVASHYAHWAIPAHCLCCNEEKNRCPCLESN